MSRDGKDEIGQVDKRHRIGAEDLRDDPVGLRDSRDFDLALRQTALEKLGQVCVPVGPNSRVVTDNLLGGQRVVLDGEIQRDWSERLDNEARRVGEAEVLQRSGGSATTARR